MRKDEILTEELERDYPDAFSYIVLSDSDKRHLDEIRVEYGTVKNACEKGGFTWCQECEYQECAHIKNPAIVYVDENGYFRHNKTDKLVHRVIMESMLNRKLHFNGLDDPNSEVVHHINYDKLNNDPSNLCVLPNSEHAKLHKKGMKPRKPKTQVFVEIAKGILVPKGQAPTSKQKKNAKKMNRTQKRKMQWNHKLRAKRVKR